MRPSFVLALIPLLSCGDNERAVSIEDLASARVDAECERLVRCGLFDTVAACHGYVRPRATEALVIAAVHIGVTRFDPLAAEVCLRELAGLSCDATSREVRVLPEACGRMLVGTVPSGGQCAADVECVSGDCELPACSRQQCCTGVCKPPPATVAVGGACTTAAECGTTAFCGTDQLCHALAAAGGSCFDDRDCEFGLACIGAGIDPGTCRALPALGESCPYLRCADIGALCNAAGVCAPAGPGAPCASDAQCSSFGLCDLDRSVCTGVPTLGMPCVTRCAGASWCDRSSGTGVCAAPLDDQLACGTDDQCASQLCEEGPAFDFCAPRPDCL